MKPELRFCESSSPACGVLEIHDGEDLWQWYWLEIRLCVFHWSTIPKKQFIIIIRKKGGQIFVWFRSQNGNKWFSQGFPLILQILSNITGINMVSIFLIKWKLKFYSRNSILSTFGPNLAWVINAGLEIWHFWLLHYCAITINLFYGTIWSYLYMEIPVHIKLLLGKCIFGIAHSDHYLVKNKNKI